MAQPARKPPTMTAVKNAARVLSDAALDEAVRIRVEQGADGHVKAQELERLACDIAGLAIDMESRRG